MIISNRGLFRKLFSFYTLIISYIPKRGHHNVIISTKSLFRIISKIIIIIITIIIIIDALLIVFILFYFFFKQVKETFEF